MNTVWTNVGVAAAAVFVCAIAAVGLGKLLADALWRLSRAARVNRLATVVVVFVIALTVAYGGSKNPDPSGDDPGKTDPTHEEDPENPDPSHGEDPEDPDPSHGDDPENPDPTHGDDPENPDPSGDDDPDEVAPVLYAVPAATPFVGDATYVGWWRNAKGAIAGTVTIKAGKAAKPEKGGQSKLTVQLVPFGAKKKSVKLAKEAMPVAGEIATVQIPDLGEVRFGGLSLSGAELDLQVGKDLSKSKDKAEKAAAKARLASKAGTWAFAFEGESGYAVFTVTVSKTGKGKLAGTLPDGTKVSVSVQGVLGETALAIPFVYAKKASLGFVFWIGDDGSIAISDLTEIKDAKGRILEASLIQPDPRHALTVGTHTFLTPYFEQSFAFDGKKWVFPKQQAKLGPEDPNPYGTKLTFTAKTGAVKGSFSILDENGKKQKFTVTGNVIGTKFYGSATCKKIGSFPVSAE